MEVSPEKIVIEEYLIDEIIRQKHRRNEDFLKLAITNVNLAKELDLREGLVYECKDGCYFNMRMPNNEKVFHKTCRYEFPEARLAVVSHYVFLKNNWIEVPVSIDKVVNEIDTTYKPLTENLRCGFIRTGLTARVYSRKIFVSNKLGNTIKPKYLPIEIEL